MSDTIVTSEIIGTVWKVEKSVGDPVKAGETIMILESMKMEIAVDAPNDGTIAEIMVQPDDSVEEEQALCRIQS